MLKKILSIWQFFQNFIGFLMTRNPKASVDFIMNDKEKITIYFTKNVFNCGASLGDYLILDYDVYYNLIETEHFKTTVNHEHGHQKQSRVLGIFYFLLVCIPSAINNIIDRTIHKSWSSEERDTWYYGRYPEKWADKLGNVER